MTRRYQQVPSSLFPLKRLKLFSALKETLKEGYHYSDLKSDLMAGIVVGLVAIPLGMAFAIASGVAPQYGLYTVIFGGAFVALLGGSKFQVTGPTAAFIVILAPIAHKFGLPGLLVSGFLAGLILLFMGIARMGKFIQFIPYPVTTGFTSGIAVVIGVLQLKDFLGLQIHEMPELFTEKVMTLLRALPTLSFIELTVGFSTLFILIYWPKINKKIPAPIIALGSMSIITYLIKTRFPELNISTIGDRFTFNIDGLTGHGIPQTLPHLNLPWNFVGQDGKMFVFSLLTVKSLASSAFAIAILGAIESLLSAVVADGMAQTKHDPDGELLALGIGNLVCPLFGGIPATGAIARTATNIRFGAKSPFSAIIHALFTLLVILLFAPYVSHLPMAALAALLMLIAYNMSERKHFMHILKVAPRSDVMVLILCFSLTVLFDMVLGVSVGVVLAALLFMQRMSQVTEATILGDQNHPLENGITLPHDIVLYEIAGPLFFGASEKASGTLVDITDKIKGVAFVMNNVPAMDITGLVAFESALNKLIKKNKMIYLVGLKKQPKELLNKSGLLKDNPSVLIFESLNQLLDHLLDHSTSPSNEVTL